MSTKSDYTEAEWELLLEVPPLVGTAVMIAASSGIGGSAKEAFAIADGVLDARDGYESNELIQALIDSRIVDKQRSAVEKLTGNPYRGKPVEEIRDITVDKCRQVAQLLADKASSTVEANEFKHWAQAVGERVAQAAKEGGFLGIGGQRISPEEVAVLEAVEEALG